MAFVACHDAPEVVQPREEAFDLPAAAIAPECPPILGGPAAAPPAMRRDHLNPALLAQARVEGVAIIRLVADEVRRVLVR